jgi:hypothetical protein
MPGLPRSRARRVLRREIQRRINARRNVLLTSCAITVAVLTVVGAWRSLWAPAALAALFVLAARVQRDGVLPASAKECGGVVSGGGEHSPKVTKLSGHGEADPC